MNLKEIVRIVGGKYNIKNNVKVKNIKTDSREIEKGDLFIALKGEKYNGEDYIEEAINKGAIACISTKDNAIKVKDTMESMYLLCKHIRNKYNIPLIAITGSNGKTTTKDLIYEILSKKYKVLKNEGNNNNIIGVSKTLFKLDNTYEIIVLEFGTNHIGEINKLSTMTSPNKAIITNIGTAHLEYFKNKKNILNEKYSIIDGMSNKDLIINGDDKLLKKLNHYKCGINKNNDLIAYNVKEYMDKVIFNIFIDKEYEVVFNNPGKHFINDILLAIKIGIDYNINIEDILESIKDFKLLEKRMNITKVDSNILINDCYNASLESISAGINYLKNIKDSKIIIIADVLELGKYSKSIHKKINRKFKSLKNKQIYTVGNYSKYIRGKHFDNASLLIEYLKDNKITNSYIYIKGSRRMELDNVVKYLEG